MTKYQNGVMWLGLALIFVRFLTTGQRNLFHNLLGTNTMQPVSQPQDNTQPQGAAQNQGKQPTPQPGPSPVPPLQKSPRQTSPGGLIQPTPSPFNGG